ncbi:beta strand repeat-containing protein [Gemmata sp.]|uniref:beta strand repeat-containing protein n=1 Tax=Gemmata sp. TaxID=1914242 RepID=UPI003F72CDC9
MLLPRFPHRPASKRKPTPRFPFLHLEQLGDRSVPAVFTVSTLADAGAGSLRQAIVNANATPGADTIRFGVAGTIELTRALPAVTAPVQIAGTTAPGFATAPVVEIDANGARGLVFNRGAAGSLVESVGVVGASVAGVTLNASSVFLYGNYVGLRLDGTTVGGNTGHGVLVNTGGALSVIGDADPARSNLISGNAGNGVFLNGASGATVAGNFIGTDATGTKRRGNGANGVQIANGASDNLIGGRTPANPPGTDPNQLSGKRPPEGNLIAGNAANGVLINSGATGNVLSGNFIGTDASGIKARPNLGHGVSIANADGNSLIGTQVNLNPFIYYNVVSGNGGDGLRVNNSDNTVIQANFFGLGSDDNAPVGNGGNGVTIAGDSRGTTLGGIIPLGNVIAANAGHGVVVRDQATGFVSENSFVGVAAFNPDTDLGNKQDGFHITSTGGNNLLRINVISSNGDDGVEVSGNARGVQVVQNMIGTNTDGAFPVPNKGNGVEVGGTARDLVIGGPVAGFSIIPVQTISGNLGHGVAFVGRARNVALNFARIGTDSQGLASSAGPQALGNQKGGVYVGPQARAIAIGSTDPNLQTVIAGNLGTGVLINGSQNNQVVGTYVGLDKNGNAVPNLGDGVRLNNAANNQIGGGGPGQTNVVGANSGNGVTLTGSGTTDNLVRGNFVGTDPTGLLARGNQGHGIQVTAGAARNVLGGQVSGDPPDTLPNEFSGARPPQGNVVSGNLGNGVLINGGSAGNALYGNLVGTDATGIAPLGNARDGVAIVGSNNTVMAGTLPTQDPFVYYNVVGGNLGNGLRVSDSNGTVIQANFFGMGTDDKTPVGNALNGVVIEGTSKNTTFGGPIPLGNVIAANGANGVVLQDQVGNLTASNNFTGVAAFSEAADLGNALDGWHITATGGNIVLKIGNIISANGDDGVEVSGAARGVQIVQDIIGLNTNGTLARPNGDNGIEIGGLARDIVIGGPQTDFSVVPTGTVSANKGYGVAVLGGASDIDINFVHIGTNSGGIAEDPANPQGLGNQKGGVFVGPNAKNVTIGSPDPGLPTTISGNVGNGVTIAGASGVTVRNAIIGVGRDGSAVPNTGDGVAVAVGGRNRVTRNSISANGGAGITLAGGANNGQVAPVLTSFAPGATSAQVLGTLAAAPNTTYTVEVFADAPPTGGTAQGKTLLGSATVTTDGSGTAALALNVALPPAGSTVVTATATDPTGNTSAFSAAIPV